LCHGRALVLLDACHWGAVTGTGSTLTSDAEVLRRRVSASNVTVLTCSTGNEFSREDDKWNHGAFTNPMGGPGSGNRWRYGAKSTTDDYRTLDVRRWAREGVLRPGYWGGWQWTCDGETVASIQMRAEQDHILLIYRHRSGDGEWKDEQYPVRIVRSPCNLGGSRAWFLCPAVGCGRRVAILYGGGIFACRHCYQLAYASLARERIQVDARQGVLTGFGRS
jgi:hypothetical protein